MTPAPAVPPQVTSFADRFWALAPPPEVPDTLPEPVRSMVIIRHFLAVLDHLAKSGRRAVPALGAILRTAELEGCLSYASPEQLRGEPLDTRSIVFSLGVMLSERLAGRHPFGAENNRSRRVERLRKGELGSGVNSFPTIAASLRQVLVRAMNPFPEERWPDLRPMRDLLAQFLTSEQPAPRLPGTQSDVQPETTRIVRRATDFGRELMDVVARHETERRPLRPASWPGGTEPPPVGATPPPLPTAAGRARVINAGPPRFGVVPLRHPPTARIALEAKDAIQPGEESVVTRVLDGGVDPLGETHLVKVPTGALDRADSEYDSTFEPSVVITLPVKQPAPRPPPIPVTVTFSAPARAAIPAAVVPRNATVFDPGEVDLRPRSRSRTLAFGLGSAGVGAAIAALAVLLLQTEPKATTSAAAVATSADEPGATPTSVEPARAVDAPAALPAVPATPATPTDAPAAIADPAVRLATAIKPCLKSDHTRMFGLTAVKTKHGAKAYFGNDDLTGAERHCVVQALATLDPLAETLLFRVHFDSKGVAVTAKVVPATPAP